MSKKSWRKVHFGKEEVWNYRVGKEYIVVRTPNKRCHIIHQMDFVKFLGYNWTYTELYRAYKNGNYIEFKPGDIKEYVQKNIRER